MSTSRVIPAFKARSIRLPPAKLPLFRSIVAHPPAPFASTSQSPASPDQTPRAAMGPHQVIFTTSPRPLIPLTNSPTNHRLWNPPAADAKGSRVVERDESGRLAKFESRFGGAAADLDAAAGGGGEGGEMGQFDPEADLSFLEGETLQSPGTPLGKRDIVGAPKSAKKGKKSIMRLLSPTSTLLLLALFSSTAAAPPSSSSTPTLHSPPFPHSPPSLRRKIGTATLQPRDNPLPYNVLNPAPTPLLTLPLAAVLLDLNHILDAVGAVLTPVTSVLGQTIAGLVDVVPALLCSLLGSCPPAPSDKPSDKCLGSNHNETMINSLFFYGGASTTVNLCPSSLILLFAPIQFTAPQQVLTTLGNPTGSTRATLKVTGAGQTNAIWGACDQCAGVRVQNVQVDGNRPGLGVALSPPPKPRGWSVLHVIEGANNNCAGAVITNNEVGPSGHSPNDAAQLHRAMSRRATGNYASGEWITDATDGAIVIFGAPGSVIRGNTIIADKRQLLGGINAIDYKPFNGNYSGVDVSGNTISAVGSMIKVGIAVGPLSWGTNNVSAEYNFDGRFADNTFTSGPSPSGQFGYGIAVGGHRTPTIVSNSFKDASFGGVSTDTCAIKLPPFGPLYKDPQTTTAGSFQESFVDSTVSYMICAGPGARTRSAVTLTN
ncbi:hypothetical protein RQP46_010546 [Phenoliferia psychrophenolica]